jgi:RND family efflux transporter MFP subunit
MGLLVAAYLLGRHSLGLDPTAVVRAESPRDHDGEEHACHDGGEHGDHAEGVISFSPEAFARARIRLEAVSTAPVRRHLQVTGSVEANPSGLVRVTPRVTGKILSLRSSVGDTVHADQVLATMTSTELAQAQAQYRQAVARTSAATTNLRRQRQLADFGEFGQHKVQEARGSFTAEQGDVSEAQADVEAARSEVSHAEAALAAAQGDEAAARGDVAAAEAAATQAQTQVEVTRSRFLRQDTLFEERLTSHQDWEQSLAELKKAESDVQGAHARVRSATAKVAAAEAKSQQAQSEIATNRARLELAGAKLAAARQRREIAERALQREEQIFRSGVLTNKEVAEAEATLRQAEIERAAAENAVRLLGGRPGGSSVLMVTAPIAGRVTERSVTTGETVSPEKALFAVANLETVWVQLEIYPRDLSAIRPGLPVTITTDAVPGQRFAGKIAYVRDAVDETTRTVKVRCVIPNPDSRLKPEMFVHGSIATPLRRHAVTVPRDSVQTLEGKTVVFVERGRPVGSQDGATGRHGEAGVYVLAPPPTSSRGPAGPPFGRSPYAPPPAAARVPGPVAPSPLPTEFEAREVQTGETIEGRIVIGSGLDPGERVVTAGAFMVKAQAMKAELGHSH